MNRTGNVAPEKKHPRLQCQFKEQIFLSVSHNDVSQEAQQIGYRGRVGVGLERHFFLSSSHSDVSQEAQLIGELDQKKK